MVSFNYSSDRDQIPTWQWLLMTAKVTRKYETQHHLLTQCQTWWR